MSLLGVQFNFESPSKSNYLREIHQQKLFSLSSNKKNWQYFFLAVFQVDNNATPETLADIMAWFQQGNNVAVSSLFLFLIYPCLCQ